MYLNIVVYSASSLSFPSISASTDMCRNDKGTQDSYIYVHSLRLDTGVKA